MSTIKDPDLFKALEHMQRVSEPHNHTNEIIKNWNYLRQLDFDHRVAGWNADPALKCFAIAMAVYGSSGSRLLTPEDNRSLMAIASKAVMKWREMNTASTVSTRLLKEIIGSHNMYGVLK